MNVLTIFFFLERIAHIYLFAVAFEQTSPPLAFQTGKGAVFLEIVEMGNEMHLWFKNVCLWPPLPFSPTFLSFQFPRSFSSKKQIFQSKTCLEDLRRVKHVWYDNHILRYEMNKLLRYMTWVNMETPHRWVENTGQICLSIEDFYLQNTLERERQVISYKNEKGTEDTLYERLKKIWVRKHPINWNEGQQEQQKTIGPIIVVLLLLQLSGLIWPLLLFLFMILWVIGKNCWKELSSSVIANSRLVPTAKLS